MATTTRGLRYPVGTDPVAIHTDLQNLATDVDGKLNVSLATTKGDLITHDGTTEVRLPVGTNGTLLRANASASSGIEWAKDFTTDSSTNGVIASYLATGSETSVLFNSIPSTYTNLDIVGRITFTAGTDSQNTLLKILINGTELTSWTSVLQSTAATYEEEPVTGIRFATVSNSFVPFEVGIIRIKIGNYASTTARKSVYVSLITSLSSSATGSANHSRSVSATRNNDAITSIEIRQENLLPISTLSSLTMYGDFGG